MAVTPVISRLFPLPRNQGVAIPDAWPAATWCDALAISATAASYTVKTDAAGNKGAILRLCATVACYYNFNDTAVVPTTATTNGTSAVLLPANTPRIVVFPNTSETLSVIGTTGEMTIEAWN